MIVPHWNRAFDTLITLTPADVLRDMADRVLCYPRHLVAAVTDTTVADDHIYRTLLRERIVPVEVTRC